MTLKKHPDAQSDTQKERGFTLVELLIVIPMASLIIVILLSALFTQYTQVIAESAKSNLRSSGQTLLINLQDELLFTISYGEQLNADLTDPYEPAGGWANDSTPETLIINEIALDSTRQDEDRHIIRQRINDCESSSISSNTVALNNVIYFVADNPTSNQDTLFKRTITPTYNLCSIDSVTGNPCTPVSATCLGNAKVTSCPEDQVGNGNCQVKDQVLSDKVENLQITYFAKNNVETEFPSSANKVEVVLTLSDKVYGKRVSVEVKHTIRKVN